MKLKHILLIVGAFFLTLDANATHILGGEIVWKCMPSGKYKFTLVLYRDCCSSCASLPTSAQSLSTNAGVSISCAYISTTDVVPQGYSSTCSPACGGTSGSGAMQKYVYRSGEITLTGTPPATGWWFTWSSCCRPGSITNGPANAGYTLRAIMYPYTPPGSTTALSAGTSTNPTCYDSSPNFLEDPQVVACTGYDIDYNNLGYDPDLDSLYYDWANPWGSSTGFPGTAVSFSSGYAYNNPLPSGSGSTGAVLDNATGEVSFNSALQGSWVTCIKIEEWRCNQKIGEIYRDIPIVTRTCTPPTGLCPSTGNNTPTLTFTVDTVNNVGAPQLSPVTNVSGDTIYYYTEVYPGDHVEFDITSTDVDLLPTCSPQQITFEASGGNLSSAANYGNVNTCLFNPPCATITSNNSNNGFTSSLNNDVTFEWDIECNHLFYQQYQCGRLKSEYDFYFKMRDNACPIPSFAYSKVVVKVKNYMPGIPDMSNSCLTYDVNGNISFDWVANPDTGFNWDYYLVNHSNNGGAWTALDTVWNYGDTTFTHSNPPSGLNQYSIQVAGGCGLISDWSDTLQTIDLVLNSFPPPPNSSVAQLQWNMSKLGDSSTVYQVWVEAPTGSGNWTMVDTTSNLFYNDTVEYCGQFLDYQIRIGNVCNSDIDTGFFSDNTNPNHVLFDSVSVVPGNLASLTWQASPNPDVVYYRILKKDNAGFFQPIDTVSVVDYPTMQPWVYTASNAGNESEEFLVQAVDSCGNHSSLGLATPSSTLFLSVGVDPCEGFARVKWNSYRTFTQTEVKEYNLYADITPPAGPTLTGVLLHGGTLDSSFQHHGVQNGYTYCYYVKAVDTTGTVYSTSNRFCNSSLTVQKSKVLYLARASVTQAGAVDLYTFIDKDADVIDFTIQRSGDEVGPFLPVGVVPKPASAPWEVKFQDFTADPNSQRYFYRISARDSCGAIDTVSNFATNIYATVEANGNLTNSVFWTPYRDWDNGVQEYIVYRSIDGGNSFSQAATTKDTTFLDNVKLFPEAKGKFCYYVKAVAKDGQIPWRDESGMPFSAKSNIACDVQKARIFVPSAFNPNSDIVENRVWRPTNVFARQDSYTLFIVDRWGNEVFRTTDVDAAWDGTFNGKELPMGVYTYYIKYRSIDDIAIEQWGTFTLLR